MVSQSESAQLKAALVAPIKHPQKLDGLIGLLADWYWEQDSNHRLTQIIQSQTPVNDGGGSHYLGKALWELGSTPLYADAGWSVLQAHLAARQSFQWFLIKHIDSSGAICYFSITGEPVFDALSGFCGYRGIGSDVTRFIRDEQLLILEHAITRYLRDGADTMLGAIVRQLCEAELWSCVGFWQLSDQGEPDLVEFAARSHRKGSVTEQHFIQSRSVVLGTVEALLKQIYQTQQPLWTEDISKAIHARSVADFPGFRSSVLFPIICNGNVFGVFDFVSHTARAYDDQFLQTITNIAAQISQVLERKQVEQTLRSSEERFRSLVHLSSDWFWQHDQQHRLTEISGMDIENIDDVLGRPFWDASLHCECVSMTLEEHLAVLEAHQPFHELIVRYSLPGIPISYSSISGEPFFNGSGEFQGYRGVACDVTARHHYEERIQYLANYDALTGLPNRTNFSTALTATINLSERQQHKFVVLFIDLDRFKAINDTLGHGAGDSLLQEMARRLTQVLRTTDTVARLGGDEFVVLMPEIERDVDVARVARKILDAVIKPFFIQGLECRVTASIGISRFPEDARSEHALMKNADIAMYRAKDEGKNNFQFYSESIKAHTLERLALETSLRRALERNEFILHYQAKLDLKTQKITGVEALLRWQHPDLGLVSPAQFIPLAEETGLIVPIGRWVLNTACAQNFAWQQAGLTPVRMAVNLSARQFTDDNLVQDIANALTASGLDAQWLELELTESMVMHDHERAIRILIAIKQMGVRLAIDDFGIGYSSLAQIKRFPIDTLKVDRAFIRDLPHNAEDRAITKAIIAMGRTLSLTIVAEGVETEEQESFLRDNACDETQGFYFSKPVAPELFADLLITHK